MFYEVGGFVQFLRDGTANVLNDVLKTENLPSGLMPALFHHIKMTYRGGVCD